MKPRLESAPETDEDVLVWLKVADGMFRRDGTLTPVRFRCLGVRSLASDRRDAELMLYAQQNRRYGWVRTGGQRETPILPGQYVHIRGGPCLGAV